MKQVFPYLFFPVGQVWKIVQVWVYSRCYEAGISIPGLPGWIGMGILNVLFQGWYWLFYDVLKENGKTAVPQSLYMNHLVTHLTTGSAESILLYNRSSALAGRGGGTLNQKGGSGRH